MSPVQNDAWKRNGFTFLWDGPALASIAPLDHMISLSAFFALDGLWQDEIGIRGSSAWVVAGLDTMIDVLAEAESLEAAEAWLEKSLKPIVMRFQTAFEGQKALVFWLPRGNERLNQIPDQGWRWRLGAGSSGSTIPLLRCLFAGAEREVQRIEAPFDLFIGLHHRRIS
jgi:hypothetical protein